MDLLLDDEYYFSLLSDLVVELIIGIGSRFDFTDFYYLFFFYYKTFY